MLALLCALRAKASVRQAPASICVVVQHVQLAAAAENVHICARQCEARRRVAKRLHEYLPVSSGTQLRILECLQDGVHVGSLAGLQRKAA